MASVDGNGEKERERVAGTYEKRFYACTLISFFCEQVEGRK